MTAPTDDAADAGEDPREAEVTGVPAGTPDQVRPSKTGTTTGPLDSAPQVEIAEIQER